MKKKANIMAVKRHAGLPHSVNALTSKLLYVKTKKKKKTVDKKLSSFLLLIFLREIFLITQPIVDIFCLHTQCDVGALEAD